MVSALQLWLSPRPPRKVSRDQVPFIFAQGAGSATFETREDGTEVIRAVHDVSKLGCQGGAKGPCAPPVHTHLTQTENFLVHSGQAELIVNGTTIFLNPGDPTLVSPKGDAHSFWPVEAKGNLDLSVWADRVEGEQGFDEEFFRNFQSYFNDLHEARMEPSPFQLMLFFISRGIVLHIPGVPLPIVKALHHFGAFIGEHILGYSSSYPEYSPEAKKTI